MSEETKKTRPRIAILDLARKSPSSDGVVPPPESQRGPQSGPKGGAPKSGRSLSPRQNRRLSPPALPSTGAPLPPATRRANDLRSFDKKRTQPTLPRPGAPALRFKESESRPAPSIINPVPLSAFSSLSRRPPVSKGVELSRIAEALAGETLMGRYRIEIPLGRGSTGIVFRAHDLPNNTRVAIKLLDPELASDPSVVARFQTEALTPTRIGTDHVVRVLEADVCPELVPIARPEDPMSPPIPYLTMELLEGKDLRQFVHEQGALSAADTCSFLAQIAPTLDRAHELGIVHRDLKPANLFLCRRGDGSPLVKVLDFGIAQLADASAARGLGGGLFGTPWYMAPEQAEGKVATAASDRWAMAMVAFRLLTAESYWAPCPVAELLAQILRGPSSLPSEIVRERGLLPRQRLGPAFDAWFMRACQIDPERRFPTVVEQIEGMQRAFSEPGT